jgi:cation diffusion facilitator family transporter
MSDAAALKEKVALSSVAASALLTLGKLAAGLASGSLALMSEAAHNALDTGATILTYYAVRQANKPADERHHYGHGKFESVSALAETGLLGGLAVYVLIAALHRLWEGGEKVDASWPAFAVLGVSIVVDLVRWLSLRKVARDTGSHALAADAMHFASDLVASALVLVGLGANAFGFQYGDPLAAVGVALFIGFAGFALGKETLATLLDAAPEGLTDKLRAAIASTPGVVAVESIKLRPNGPQVLGEIGIAVSRTLPILRVAEIEAAVRARIAEVSPETEAIVTAAPRALDDETITERVLLLAARRKLPVHHIMVQHLDARDSIAFDLEIDGAMSQGDAHRLATALENDIKSEIDPTIEVESRIEPLHNHALTGHEADPETLAQIAGALRIAANEGGVARNIHAVRVRVTEDGVVVAFHAVVDPKLSVAETHDAMGRIERALRDAAPGLLHVVGHAEPLGAE